MSDLTTKYMGLTLKSPLVASASPLCESAENISRLEDQGIAAVVLPSLFEEQLALESQRVDDDLERGSDSFPESLNFFPDLQTYNLGPDGYLELIRAAKSRVADPGDREPQRRHIGRMDRIRPSDAGRGCGCDRAEHLFDRD